MTEAQIQELENRLLSKLEERLQVTENSVRNTAGNLNFLRELVEESVHLTEQTSGIVVEHVNTLDQRLSSVAGIFTDKIVRQLKEMNEDDFVSKLAQIEEILKSGNTTESE